MHHFKVVYPVYCVFFLIEFVLLIRFFYKAPTCDITPTDCPLIPAILQYRNRLI